MVSSKSKDTQSPSGEVDQRNAELVANARTLEELYSGSVAQPRLQTLLLGAFSMLALTLAAVGVYGLFSYSTARRLVTLVLVSTALVAGFVPAWRAAKVEPVTVLREE